MIRVLVLALAKFLRQVLGLQESHRLDFPDFTLVYLPQCGDRLRDRTHAQQGAGRGLHARQRLRPCGVVVNDVASTREALVAKGYEARAGEGIQARRRTAGALFLRPGPRTATRSKCWSGTATTGDKTPSMQSAPRYVSTKASKRIQRPGIGRRGGSEARQPNDSPEAATVEWTDRVKEGARAGQRRKALWDGCCCHGRDLAGSMLSSRGDRSRRQFFDVHCARCRRRRQATVRSRLGFSTLSLATSLFAGGRAPRS